jgi:hypothetical protein
MALSIVNWNIDENRVWFARLEDTGSEVSVELYLTQADAEARENLQASGESSGYGSELEVTLVNEDGATVPVTFLQEEYAWHLVVSGQNGDSLVIFKMKEFIEMDEISHAIYRNSTLITARATAEIDAHTHAAIIRQISLGVHLPELEVGQVAGLNSTRRGVNDLSQVNEIQIIGSISNDGTQSLVNELETRKYIELKR